MEYVFVAATDKIKLPNSNVVVSKSATRAQRTKAITREALREKFKGAEYIRQLELTAKQYDAIIETLEVCTTRRLRLLKTDVEKMAVLHMQQDLLKLRLDTIKGKMDLNFKRLKFVLPELRSVEIVDSDGKNPWAAMAAAILEATRANAE